MRKIQRQWQWAMRIRWLWMDCIKKDFSKQLFWMVIEGEKKEDIFRRKYVSCYRTTLWRTSFTKYTLAWNSEALWAWLWNCCCCIESFRFNHSFIMQSRSYDHQLTNYHFHDDSLDIKTMFLGKSPKWCRHHLMEYQYLETHCSSCYSSINSCSNGFFEWWSLFIIGITWSIMVIIWNRWNKFVEFYFFLFLFSF